MTNAISNSLISSYVKRGTSEIMKEQNRRAIVEVFSKAKYDSAGLAKATHQVVGRAFDKSGNLVKVGFLPKVNSQSMLRKIGNWVRSFAKYIK